MTKRLVRIDVIVNDKTYELIIPKKSQESIAGILTLVINKNVRKSNLPDIDYVGMPFLIEIKQVISKDLEKHV